MQLWRGGEEERREHREKVTTILTRYVRVDTCMNQDCWSINQPCDNDSNFTFQLRDQEYAFFERPVMRLRATNVILNFIPSSLIAERFTYTNQRTCTCSQLLKEPHDALPSLDLLLLFDHLHRVCNKMPVL